MTDAGMQHQVHAALLAAKSRLERGRCRGAYARDAKGEPVDPQSAEVG